MGQYEDFVSELQASIFADSFPYCSELIRGLSAEMKAAPRDPAADDPQASRLAYAEEPGLLSCLLQAVSTPVRRAALECLATASDPACCRRRVLDEPLLMSTLQDAFRDPKMPSRERAELMRTLANLAAHAPLRAELAADAGFVAFLFDAVYLASPAKGMRPAAREGVGAVLEVLVKLLEDPASHGSIPEERFEPTLCYAFNFAASKVFKILELVASNRSGLHQSSRSLVCTRLFVTNFLLAMHTREPDPEQHEEKLLQTFRVMAELSRLEAGRAYLRDYTTLSDTMLVWEMTKFLKYADVRRMMLNVCTIGPLNTDEARVRGEGDPEDFVIDADQFGEQGPPPLHFLSRPLFHQAMIARGLIEASTDVAAFLPAALELAEKSRVGEAVRAMMRRTQAGIDRGICRGGEPGGGQELRTLTKTFRLEFKYTKGYAERVGKDKAKYSPLITVDSRLETHMVKVAKEQKYPPWEWQVFNQVGKIILLRDLLEERGIVGGNMTSVVIEPKAFSGKARFQQLCEYIEQEPADSMRAHLAIVEGKYWLVQPGFDSNYVPSALVARRLGETTVSPDRVVLNFCHNLFQLLKAPAADRFGKTPSLVEKMFDVAGGKKTVTSYGHHEDEDNIQEGISCISALCARGSPEITQIVSTHEKMPNIIKPCNRALTDPRMDRRTWASVLLQVVMTSTQPHIPMPFIEFVADMEADFIGQIVRSLTNFKGSTYERIRLTCLLSACVKYCDQKQMLVALSVVTPLASPKVQGYDVSVGYNCSITIFQVVFRALNELGTILPEVRSNLICGPMSAVLRVDPAANSTLTLLEKSAIKRVQSVKALQAKLKGYPEKQQQVDPFDEIGKLVQLIPLLKVRAEHERKVAANADKKAARLVYELEMEAEQEEKIKAKKSKKKANKKNKKAVEKTKKEEGEREKEEKEEKERKNLLSTLRAGEEEESAENADEAIRMLMENQSKGTGAGTKSKEVEELEKKIAELDLPPPPVEVFRKQTEIDEIPDDWEASDLL